MHYRYDGTQLPRQPTRSKRREEEEEGKQEVPVKLPVMPLNTNDTCLDGIPDFPWASFPNTCGRRL